ncbi:hypothetical protein J7M22_09855 [Candidatus Poribacteria bacterium]|nr:hypothetical protein [Candidatus Poribacteria bacterium]
MTRIFLASALIAAVFILGGCAAIKDMMNTVAAGQQWSENYARLPGVEATDPKMVDGDLRTSGETVAESFYPKAVVKLPEPKVIHKIVIYSPNLQTFSIWADRGNGWEQIKEIKSVKGNPIVVMTSVRTDKIMISVSALKSGRLERKMVRRRRGIKGEQAIIQEIELYGFTSPEESKAVAAQKEEKKVKEELKDLLEPAK